MGTRDQRRRGVRGLAIAAIAVGSLATVGLAVGVAAWRGSSAGPTRATPPPFDVVIYLIDTLRADRVGAYGYGKPTSPTIDELAKESVVFENCSAAAPWTLPSIVAMQTSLPPCEHGVLVDGHKLRSSIMPLAERMRSQGYLTASFIANPYAGKSSGLDRGYDLCKPTRTRKALPVGPWLNSVAGRRIFLYLHTMEVHDPHMTPAAHLSLFANLSRESRKNAGLLARTYRVLSKVDFDAGKPLGTTDNTADQAAVMGQMAQVGELFSAMYDASVHHADANLAATIASLKRSGRWDNTLFILTADHGEELGDHGGWQHDQSAYEELLHVPLLIKFPQSQFAGRRVREHVSSLDILPTLFDAVGRSAAAGPVRGESLMKRLRDGERPGGEPRLVSLRHNLKKYYKPWHDERGEVNVVLRDGSWKAIYNAQRDALELYDLASDPGERTNLSTKETDRAERMKSLAKRLYDECAARGPAVTPGSVDALDAESRSALESLGYIGTNEKDEPDDAEPTSRPTRRP